MALYVLAVLASLLGVTSASRKISSIDAPTVTIVLPERLKSETVQISYFMIGPFGGYGGYEPAKPDVNSYRITAEVEGQAAHAIKIIIYAPGCKIQKFDLALSPNRDLTEQFVCEPLPSTTLAGQVPADFTADGNAEIVVEYMAYWSHKFCGISDGMVPEFQIAICKPERDGTFSIAIPDFSADMDTSPATLHLVLYGSTTGNHIALGLEPELSEFRTETHELRIQATYPAGMRFLPAPGNIP
jgi:hypothetical protein